MRRSSNSQSAAVLLEVVLALLLFVATVAVVAGVLNSSMTSMERQRTMIHAANLAVTVHSEIDLGLRGSAAQGAQEFGPEFPGWTWELAQVSAEAEGAMAAVEVVIRSTNSPVVYRLTQAHRARAAEVAP
jgi:hypothetical protein